jgi:hypothetical protein
VHASLSSWIRRPRPSVALRRKLGATAGAVGVLALCGSGLNPVTQAFARSVAAPQQGSLTLVTPAYPAWPMPAPGATPAWPLNPMNPLAAISPSAQPFGAPSSIGLVTSGIPEPAQRAYVAAAAELARTDPTCRLSWTLIAGIGRVESNHGRYGGSSVSSDGMVRPPILGIRLDGIRPGTARITDSDNGRYDGDPVLDRAVGPMQFLPGTWKTYGAGLDPQNMNASALATGRYLCVGDGSLDTQQGRSAAVYRYNHSDSYVAMVLSLADSYAAGGAVPFPNSPSASLPPYLGPPAGSPSTSKPATKPSTKPTGKPTTKPTGKPTTKPNPTGGSTPTDKPTPSDEPSPTSDKPSPTTKPTPPDEPSPSPSPSVTPSPSCPPPGTEPNPSPSPSPNPDCPVAPAAGEAPADDAPADGAPADGALN